MVDRREIGSWLDGPRFSRADEDYVPGQGLGLPADGPGSVATFGRRAIGICLDWALCLLAAQVIVGDLTLTPLMFLAVLHLVLVGTTGASPGHFAVGVRVRAVTGERPGILRAAVRTALLCLAVPPLVSDRDQRGLHDKAAGTVVVRH